MQILVPVKRVVDYNLRVRPTPDGRAVDTAGLKMSINPFDEIALESAVRLRESGCCDGVTAVTIGPAVAEDVLRHALAMGADRAVRLDCAEAGLQPRAVSALLAAYLARQSHELVLMGKQAIDDDFNQTAQMLAARLGWPQLLFASAIALDDRQLTACCETDVGRETLSTALPAVVSADLRLPPPRFAALPAILRARRAPVEVLDATDFGVDLAPTIDVLAVAVPEHGRQRRVVDSAQALLDALPDDLEID